MSTMDGGELRAMRTTLPLLLLLGACGGPSTTDVPTQAPAPPPAVFEEPASIGEVVKSRGYERGDVVERLFAEALERDTALANLLAGVDQVRAMFNDSTEAFQEFRAHNAAFHASADAHVQALADSTDRRAWSAALQENRDLLAERTAPAEALIKARTTLDTEVERLRALLMLEHALAAMRNYQQNGMPSTAGMAHTLARLKALRDGLRNALAQAEGR